MNATNCNRPLDAPDFLVCSSCRKTKHYLEFHKAQGATCRGFRSYHCIACSSARSVARAQERRAAMEGADSGVGMDIKEISTTLGLDSKTIRNTLRSALEKAKPLFEARGYSADWVFGYAVDGLDVPDCAGESDDTGD